MRVRIEPGGIRSGDLRLPGDKSIAHRWLILAATARGSSRLEGLPLSLDVRSTAACLARINGTAAPALEAWAGNVAGSAEGHGSTWNETVADPAGSFLEVEGQGRAALVEPRSDLDCGNSGTSIRLLAGLLAGTPFRSVLVGDESLSSRPMERVAEPLRLMGATITTTNGHAPLEVTGTQLHGIAYRLPVPSAQVKSAILFAGLAADGRTEIDEPIPTRDHTERALAALGAPLTRDGSLIGIERFQHGGFRGSVPGDPSAAAFLVAASALRGSALTLVDVGLNPTRLGFLDVMRRMGVAADVHPEEDVLGEPVGELRVSPASELSGTTVGRDELPSVVDEVPILAVLGACARGETRFRDAGELRVKETDRLRGIADCLIELGGHADVDGDDLVIAGTGLSGGRTASRGDHRLAMAAAIGALAADTPCEIEGMEAADVSFPGFLRALRSIGATVEIIA